MLEIGKTYEVAYPFILEEMINTNEIIFRPKISYEMTCVHTGHGEIHFDGIGYVLLTVIDKFKPKIYPERIFFIRNWKTPDGNIFGTKKLRITTSSNFKKMLKGHRYMPAEDIYNFYEKIKNKGKEQ